jgi:hypothetical protein
LKKGYYEKMGYYVRLLTHSDKNVTFGDIFTREESIKLAKGTDANWDQIEIREPEENLIAIVEKHPVDRMPGETEIVRLKDDVSRAYPVNAREWVLTYLSRVKTIYSFQLMTDNIDTDDKWRTLGRVQNALKDALGGIIQSDNEGYYNESGDYILWQMYAGARGTVPAAALDEKEEWITFQLNLDDSRAVDRFKQGEMPRRGLMDIFFKK